MTIGRASQSLFLPNFTTNGGLLYTNASGLFTQLGAGTTGQCLLSNTGAAPAWGSCDGVASVDVWSIANGTAQLSNTTLDLLVGGTTTASAKFAILNVNGSGPATATISGNLIVMPTNGAGGNVGIGTTDPAGSLDIVKNQDGGTYVNISNSDGGTFAYAEYAATNGTGYAEFGIGGTGYTYNPALQNKAYVFANINTDGLVLQTQSTDPISFITNSIEAGRFASNGVLGIGTINPVAQLDVTRALSQGVTGKALAIFNQIENQDIFSASASGVTKFTIKNDGTASTSGNLVINAAGSLQTTNGQTLTVGGGGTGNINIDTAASNAISNKRYWIC